MTFNRVIPQIRTTNIDDSIEFYVSKLGFELDFRYEDFYAGIKVGDDQIIHLKLVDYKDPSIDYVLEGGHFHLFFYTEEVESYAEKLKANGVELHSEVSITPRGTKDLYVLDNQGHVLCFSQSPET